MLEALSIAGDEITVLDHEILWGRRGLLPLWQRRRVWTNLAKVLPGSRITVVRPGMLRVPGISRFSWLLTTWLELARFIRAGRPDVIVAYGLSNSFIALLYARKHHVPFVFHLFDSLHALAEPKALRPVAALVEGQLLRSADQVVIPYRALAGYVARIGVRTSRVRQIPHGVTRRRIDPAIRATMRSKLGLSDDDIALLFIGWLYEHSGLAELAFELASKKAEYSRFKVIVVGDGDLSSNLEDIRSANGLEDRLILTGRRPVEEMSAFIVASDVCLLPSLPTDATRFIVPTKVDEYLELGRPVVATSLEGMRAEYADVKGIIWVDHPAEVLPRLAELLSGPTSPAEVLGDLSRASIEYVAARDDWETVTRRFRAVLTSTRPR
jgi:glycosyltransferase involved in cell wall biosynthesis